LVTGTWRRAEVGGIQVRKIPGEYQFEATRPYFFEALR
jgi:hypothetical protein